MKQQEERLSGALRELAASSRQGPSPELGLFLQDAFRRRHADRKRTLKMRIGLLCACAIVLSGSLLLREPLVKAPHLPVVTARTVPPQEVQYAGATSASRIKRPILARKASAGSSRLMAANTFVALPSFAMVPAGDDLRVIRLELPGEDLGLMGGPVMEKFTGRRVTADFVVGHDGTPYAVRLVQSKY